MLSSTAELPHIRFRIAKATTGADGRYRLAAIRMVEDTTRTALGKQYPKYLQDIICHALSLTQGTRIDGNDRFTYTFPFSL